MLKSRLRMIKDKSNKRYKSDNSGAQTVFQLESPIKQTHRNMYSLLTEVNMDLKINRDLTKDENVCKFKVLVKRRAEKFGCYLLLMLLSSQGQVRLVCEVLIVYLLARFASSYQKG